MDVRAKLAEALAAEIDEHGYEDDDEKRGQVAWHFADVLLSLEGVAIVADARRWYAAAFLADNGNVCTISEPNTIRKYAEQDAERMRSPEDTAEIFVAYRDIPPWVRAAEAATDA